MAEEEKFGKEDYLAALDDMAEVMKRSPSGHAEYLEEHRKRLARSQNDILSGKESLELIGAFIPDFGSDPRLLSRIMVEYSGKKAILEAASDPIVGEMKVCEFNIATLDAQLREIIAQKEQMDKTLRMAKHSGNNLEKSIFGQQITDRVKLMNDIVVVGSRFAKVERAMMLQERDRLARFWQQGRHRRRQLA